MLVLNLPFKALMFLTLMRPSLVLFLVLWLKLVKDFLKVRCRLALLPFLISCLIWLDLVASLPLIKERLMSNIQTGAERMPHDLSHLGFLAGQIGRLITISTTPVIAGDSFEMDAVGALRLSPLRRGL